MATISTGIQFTNEKTLISEMLTLTLEYMTEDDRKKMLDWIQCFEEYVEQRIHELGKKILVRRRPEILVAAAIYDAFLEYENRTSVKFRLPIMREAFNLTPSTINSTWTRLFDNRSSLRKDFLNPVFGVEAEAYSDAVIEILRNIRRAILGNTREVDLWLTEIGNISIRFLESMDKCKAKEYDTVLVGTGAIYAAIHTYPGKPRIQISQRDLAQFCCHSSSMLSKVWLELFSSLFFTT